MASPNQSNGSSPPFPSPSAPPPPLPLPHNSPASQAAEDTQPSVAHPALPVLPSLIPSTVCVKRSRSASPVAAGLVAPPQPRFSYDDAYIHPLLKGRLSSTQAGSRAGTIPTWNAAALLNPKAFATSAAKPQPSKPAREGTTAAETLSFQFSSPDGNASNSVLQGSSHSSPSKPHAANVSNGGAANMGTMLERMNNVQERSSVPVPKRRKLESVDGSPEPKQGFQSGAGGILGEYVKQKQSEGKPSPLSTAVDSVDLTGGDDDSDAKVMDVKNLEVCFGMIDGAQLNCHRVPAPKQGMMSVFGPGYWPQVKVVLRRISGDKTTTIQVYDHTRQVFGNVDPKTSAGLCQLLDSKFLQLRTDCIIPPRRRQPDEEEGKPISRAYKVQLMLYGKQKHARIVGKYLADAGIMLLSPKRVEAGIKVLNPHASENKAYLAAKYSLPARSSEQHAVQPTTVRTVEEIRSDVMTVFDSLAQTDTLPELDATEVILTPLLKHQKQALYFMTKREETIADTSTDKPVDAMWQRRQGKNAQVFFCNIITGQNVREPPPKALGGILADMMGLGKTLSVLSLITYTRKESEHWGGLAPVQPATPPQRSTHASHRFDPPTAVSLGLTEVVTNAKATLLVCPLSTVTNWEEQIKQHIKPGTLRYHIYHGPHRIRDPAKLAEFDLVITTYGSVSSELNSRHKSKKGTYPLEEVAWFRIVLDEAHMIREQNTLQFKSICRLQANRRWAVTGTPVQNKLDDLASLLAFLRLQPFDDRNKFSQYILQPFKMCDPEIVPKLRILVDTITLRRLKDKIDLPPRTDQVVKLQFSPDERSLYDLFSRQAKERVQVLTGSRDHMVGGKTYIHILQAILRLRLICAHGKDLLTDEDLELVQGMSRLSAIELDSDSEEDKPVLPEKKAYDLFDLMKETNTDLCIRCSRKLGSNDGADIESERGEDVLGYMTHCFHLFCPECIKEFKDDMSGASYTNKVTGNCPVCFARVSFACVELRQTRAAVEHDSHGQEQISRNGKNTARYGGPHTKTRALLDDLLNSKAESEAHPDEPPFKSVVFSGWTSHLDLIQVALDDAGITYTRLDGKMTRTARTQAMDAFREDPFIQVILVSITAGGLGLNLTAANSVFVMEPQYNPAAEAQAIDRVHRLGQKRPVRTVRYIMEDSFEEKMLDLQDKKKKLAALSMDGGNREGVSRADAARQRLADLKDLFK